MVERGLRGSRFMSVNMRSAASICSLFSICLFKHKSKSPPWILYCVYFLTALFTRILLFLRLNCIKARQICVHNNIIGFSPATNPVRPDTVLKRHLAARTLNKRTRSNTHKDNLTIKYCHSNGHHADQRILCLLEFLVSVLIFYQCFHQCNLTFRS